MPDMLVWLSLLLPMVTQFCFLTVSHLEVSQVCALKNLAVEKLNNRIGQMTLMALYSG
jgi:hypothetical protein